MKYTNRIGERRSEDENKLGVLIGRLGLRLVGINEMDYISMDGGLPELD